MAATKTDEKRVVGRASHVMGTAKAGRGDARVEGILQPPPELISFWSEPRSLWNIFGS